MVDFIGVYEKTCPPDMCKEIIDFFEDFPSLGGISISILFF